MSSFLGKFGGISRLLHSSLRSWGWVPSLYFAEGIPYVFVMVVAVVMYKDLGMSNEDAVFLTSLLYLPWVIKPFWSPLIDMMQTKRWWILRMQFLMAGCFAILGFFVGGNCFVAVSLGLFSVIAMASATHDIAADGYYMLALSPSEQSLFVGIRSIFYRLASIVGQGGLIYLAGYLNSIYDDQQRSWALVIYAVAALLALVVIFHMFILPRPKSDVTAVPLHINSSSVYVSPLSLFLRAFSKFFHKKGVLTAVLFIVLFRLGEAQLSKVCQLFLKDSLENGGLGFNNMQVGFVYGTAGIIALSAGGILGGFLVSRHGLKAWFWPMVFSMNLPNIVYIYMALFQPQSDLVVASLICIEQFGYGFGFTAFMLYQMYFSRGRFQTSDYAICTGFMALGMMLPGLIAGWIAEAVGYVYFFLWATLCTLPGIIVAGFLPIADDYGKEEPHRDSDIL